jgi:hypothetical protein
MKDTDQGAQVKFWGGAMVRFVWSADVNDAAGCSVALYPVLPNSSTDQRCHLQVCTQQTDLRSQQMMFEWGLGVMHRSHACDDCWHVQVERWCGVSRANL